ncbi:hypothetical protein E0L93_14575 [Rubrobacter taiwanensis]|uniref:DUF4097 domain-containing protein n=1 Tax=Rubrobacter taiwanensis TaxID=185139 RepID=A0A4R1B9N9_9ACTN|nr:DUF4097 family beta strand repeat-containing protein [Rubrobacter taiwanensis]TCJ13640.1 hypothetical protein E0L93_14575 [Rubrobacter taiwanensis]
MRDERERERREEGGEGRGRRTLILAAVLAALIGLAAAGLYLWRSYDTRAGGTSEYGESVNTGEEPAVTVRGGVGRVIVEGREGLEAVEITARRHARGPDEAAAEQRAAGIPIDIEREGDTLYIESGGGRNTAVDYELAVPAGSSVTVETGSGAVEVRGVLGDVTAGTGAGDVTVAGSRGSVTVETSAGDATVENVTTETGRLSLRADAGSVELRDLTLGTLDVRVGAGDVELAGRIRGSGEIRIERGNVIVGVPEEDTASLSFEVWLGEVMREGEE